MFEVVELVKVVLVQASPEDQPEVGEHEDGDEENHLLKRMGTPGGRGGGVCIYGLDNVGYVCIMCSSARVF